MAETNQTEFAGIFPYLVSPIDEGNGTVREDVLCALVDHLIDEGVHGLSPLGSTGEFPYLTFEQRVEIVRVVVEAAAGRVPIVPGVGAYTPEEAIRQGEAFVELGADGVVLILQSYFSLSPRAVERFFTVVASAVRCPIVIYTNPRLLGFDMSPGLLAKLSRISNIQYVKDASPNTGRILTIMNAVAGNIAVEQGAYGPGRNEYLADTETVSRRLKVFGASAHIPLLIFQLGGVGWMAGPACVLPAQCVRLYELAQEDRWDEAWRLQRPLWRINEVFRKYSLAACIKAGLEFQGFEVGPPLAPQEHLSDEALYEIRESIRSLSNIHRE